MSEKSKRQNWSLGSSEGMPTILRPPTIDFCPTALVTIIKLGYLSITVNSPIRGRK